ncbi:MAG: fumarylacetoacetate hydrolase family protein [Devosia sp.]
MLDIEPTAAVLVDLFGSGRSAPLLTATHPTLDLPTAYQIADAVRRRRLDRDGQVLGRKIGFTNHRMWEKYAVKAPIWGYMYQSTVRHVGDEDHVSLSGFPEPKIEPEIVFGLGATPGPGMGEAELLGCIDWVALGFELVSSIYAGWQFQPADAVAAYGVHFALRVGARIPVRTDDWMRSLGSFRLGLFRNGNWVTDGSGADVLGSPLSALRHLNDLLSDPAFGPPLTAGEIISTGTLTLAMDASPGDEWRAEPVGVALPSITIRLT